MGAKAYYPDSKLGSSRKNLNYSIIVINTVFLHEVTRQKYI